MRLFNHAIGIAQAGKRFLTYDANKVRAGVVRTVVSVKEVERKTIDTIDLGYAVYDQFDKKMQSKLDGPVPPKFQGCFDSLAVVMPAKEKEHIDPDKIFTPKVKPAKP